MSSRLEFVQLASAPEANTRELCRRFGISPPTAYTWLARYRAEGEAGLVNRSRRPRRSPGRTAAEVEERVVSLRDKHPARGGRTLHQQLVDEKLVAVPAASTITGILRRHGRLEATENGAQRPWRRFEHEAPNLLWQMDFKGHIALGRGRCHPLTVLDDHSRFSLCLGACADERTETVQEHLIRAFRRYGLPARIAVDNGSPWGTDGEHRYTRLTVWLARLGIAVSHSRPYHPQTLGKEERFHRTLKAELLRDRPFETFARAQAAFDRWRDDYNLRRPHQGIGLAVPASRYQPSHVSYPETLPPLEYGQDLDVRRVDVTGRLSYRNREYRVGKALVGQAVGLRLVADTTADTTPDTASPTITEPTMLEVYLGPIRITTIDTNHPATHLNV